MKIIKLLKFILMISLVVPALVLGLTSCAPDMKDFVVREGCIEYIPKDLDPGKKYPLLFVFSPDGNATNAASYLREVADKEKVIILADGHFKEGVDLTSLFPKFEINLNRAMRQYPIDPDRIIAVGFDEGATAAYLFCESYPSLVNGVIANCGIMIYGSGEFRSQGMPKDFPRNKSGALLSTHEDFRYNQMLGDQKNLEAMGWNCKFFVFSGGDHVTAPKETYIEAVKWIKEDFEKKKGGATPAKSTASENKTGKEKSKTKGK